MMKFNPKERCPKCGSQIPEQGYDYRVIMLPGIFKFEYLEIQCNFCKFKFKRAPLDAKEIKDGSET